MQRDVPHIEEMRPNAPDREERVLVCLGYARNSEVVRRVLAGEGIHPVTVPDVDALADAVREGAAAVIVGSGVLVDRSQPLREALRAQPVWSDLPVVVLVPPGRPDVSGRAIAEKLGSRTAAKMLEQPARSFEIISLFKGELQRRMRQYELRDLLQRERELRAELQESRHELMAINRSLDERVGKRTEQVRELSGALTRAEQQERRRVARLLHDDLQQTLYAVQMKVDDIRRDVADVGREGLLEDVEKADGWIARAIDVTRRLTVDLSPPVLRSDELTETLGWLASRMQDLHGLTVDVEAVSAYRMPDEDLRVLLFQILRELLFNVVKHADTLHARITLAEVDERIRIEVVDEGCGFSPEEAASTAEKETGFGLFSIRERLQLLGGSMDIDARPGAGTRVRLDLPVRLE